jgi:hypothetical protein
MIETLGDAVCGLHRARGEEERMFLGLASKPRTTVSPSLASKPVATIFPCLACGYSCCGWPQNHSLRFLGMGLKTSSSSLVICPTKSPRWFLGLA